MVAHLSPELLTVEACHSQAELWKNTGIVSSAVKLRECQIIPRGLTLHRRENHPHTVSGLIHYEAQTHTCAFRHVSAG